MVGLSCKYKVASVTCLLSDFILPQNMVEHLHAFLFLSDNGINSDEIGAFVGTLIRMQWLRGLNLKGKCVIMVTIARVLSFTRFLGFLSTHHTLCEQ